MGKDSIVAQALKALREASRTDYGSEDEGNDDKDEEEIDNKTLNEATRDNLKQLFEECVTLKPLHLGLARHILRRATQLRSNILLSIAMEHLDVLAPVLRDLVRYLRVAVPKGAASHRYGVQIVEHLGDTEFGDVPFVHLWLLEFLRLRPETVTSDVALRIAEKSERLLGLRMSALLARAHRQGDWVRSHKETWRNHRDWDRRAILASASILPTDERKHWLAMVRGTSSGVDRAVASFILAT